MGGNIHFDDDYDSGIEGHPGTRFIIDLQTSSIDPPTLLLPVDEKDVAESDTAETNDFNDDDGNSSPIDLPGSLKVLFVDDDQVLRKLFVRSICAVAPGWTVREAASGEAALRLVESDEYDLIFCDMYMASVEKQLLGSETVSELRAKGITSKICGLSANDKESEFKDAGADAFMFKPMPCDANALALALRRILFSDSREADMEDSLFPNF